MWAEWTFLLRSQVYRGVPAPADRWRRMTSDLYAPPHCPFFVFFFCTFCRCLFGDAVASLSDEFFDDDELMVGLGSAKSCKIA